MVLLIALILHAAAQEPPEPAVEAIEETRSTISQTEREQREAMAHLFSINRRIKDIALKKARLNERMMSHEAAVREAAQDVNELEEKTSKHQDMLNHRLRQLYQGQTHRGFQWLFAARSPVELERNHRFLRRMVDNDHRYVVEYLQKLEQLRRKKKRLTALVGKLVEMQKHVRAQEQELTTQMRVKSRLVAELRKTKRSMLSELKSLRDINGDQQILEYAFFERKGSLSHPVAAPLGREYGTIVDPKFRFRLMHKGHFYATPTAVPVAAVFGGKVVLAAALPGYGKTVILDHGDNYFTVYGFASQLKVREGAEVKEGDTIALSGHESPLFGPGLYFEIRHFTDAVDPRPWIKEPGIKTAAAMDSKEAQ